MLSGELVAKDGPLLFFGQLLIAALAIMLPFVSLFKLAIAAQTLNAMTLPLVFYYLIRLTSDKKLMKEHANTRFQRVFAIIATIIIAIASIATLIMLFFQFG